MDDPAAVGEARGAQDLDASGRSRAPGSSGASSSTMLLERAPLEVLHRDVVGAVPLAAVVDRHDVLVLQAGGGGRLAAEALDELLVLGEAAVEELQRDACARAAGPRRSRRRPCRPSRGGAGSGSARRRSVSASSARSSQRRLHDGLGDRRRHRRRPCPSAHSIVAATAMRGSRAGAKAMNHTWLGPQGRSTSAVPVLPADLDARAARPPCPSPRCTTLRIIASTFWARLRGHHPRQLVAARSRSTTRPSRSTTRSARRGRMSRPSLATAAATIAICSGVTLSLSWPMAMRPTSTAPLVGGMQRPLRVLAAGAALVGRQVERRPARRSPGGPCSGSSSPCRASRPPPPTRC